MPIDHSVNDNAPPYKFLVTINVPDVIWSWYFIDMTVTHGWITDQHLDTQACSGI